MVTRRELLQGVSDNEEREATRRSFGRKTLAIIAGVPIIGNLASSVKAVEDHIHFSELKYLVSGYKDEKVIRDLLQSQREILHTLYKSGYISEPSATEFNISPIYNLNEYKNNFDTRSDGYTIIHGDIHKEGESVRIQITNLTDQYKVSVMLLPDIDINYAVVESPGSNSRLVHQDGSMITNSTTHNTESDESQWCLEGEVCMFFDGVSLERQITCCYQPDSCWYGSWRYPCENPSYPSHCCNHCAQC